MRFRTVAAVLPLAVLAGLARPGAAAAPADGGPAQASGAPAELFPESTDCMACHNGLVTPSGEDVSIGTDWQSSMMAHAARDPYWLAAVRRESIDHPSVAGAIEDECAKCHMPMATYEAHATGGRGAVFPHTAALKDPRTASRADRLAMEGVGCGLCHQIQPEKLGTEESFVAGFVIDTATPMGRRPAFGPFDVPEEKAAVMRSASRLEPAQGEHVLEAGLCATCHTLYTHAFGPDGDVVGRLPEQVPFLEWKHSAYGDALACQGCHMPPVAAPTPISSVLGEPREGGARHQFRGGNFFMLALMGRHAETLGTPASSLTLANASRQTLAHLQSQAARIEVTAAVADGTLTAEVTVENLAGHKLPTAYPSRRAWLHLTVRDRRNKVVFESGRMQPDGSIAGNDNDADPSRFEPHHLEITSADQVQIYEPILGTPAGEVTTGLLRATRYLKDNRILPDGFDPATAGPDIAVQGAAKADPDFQGGSDRIRYRVSLGAAEGPYRVEAALWYQPIGFRWAENQAPYPQESARFVSLYRGMASQSGARLAQAVARAEAAPAER